MLTERLTAPALGFPGASEHSEQWQPAHIPMALPVSVSPGHNGQVSVSEPGHLLIVDDNDDNRDVLARRLEQHGHTVVKEPGGAEALARLAEESFDLVLLDILMPDMDGIEVLTRIKSDPKLRHVPVIMISAIDEMETAVQCLEMGASDYLPKPFNPVLLRARVATALRAKRSHDREVRTTNDLHLINVRLKEAEQMRDDLKHVITQDLRAPLTTLMSSIQVIADLGQLDESQQRLVEEAEGGGQKLMELISRLTD
jgi:CheY-like chemotaxis protein